MQKNTLCAFKEIAPENPTTWIKRKTAESKNGLRKLKYFFKINCGVDNHLEGLPPGAHDIVEDGQQPQVAYNSELLRFF